MTDYFGPGVGQNPTVYPQAGRREFLQACAALGLTRGAEIGVWKGGFAEKMCRAIPGLSLLCVDPWRTYEAYQEQKNNQILMDAAYREAVARLAPFACTIRRQTSVEAAANVPDQSLDFVYLDGNHRRSFVIEDLTIWAPKVRPGGLIAGHDYRDNPRKPFIEVKAAVDAFTHGHQITPWFVLARDQSPSFCWVHQCAT